MDLVIWNFLSELLYNLKETVSSLISDNEGKNVNVPIQNLKFMQTGDFEPSWDSNITIFAVCLYVFCFNKIILHTLERP